MTSPVSTTTTTPTPPLGGISQLPHDVQSHFFSFFNEVEIALLSAETSLGGKERVVYQRRLQELGAGSIPLSECTLEKVEEVSTRILCEVRTRTHALVRHRNSSFLEPAPRTSWHNARNMIERETLLLWKKLTKKMPAETTVSAISSLRHMRLLESALLKRSNYLKLFMHCNTALCENWVSSLRSRAERARPAVEKSHDSLYVTNSIQPTEDNSEHISSLFFTVCRDRWHKGHPVFRLPSMEADLPSRMGEELLETLQNANNPRRKVNLLTNFLSVVPPYLLATFPAQDLPENHREKVGLAWHARRALHGTESGTSATGLLQQAEVAANALNISTLSKTKKRIYAAFSLRQLLTVEQWRREELEAKLRSIISTFPPIDREESSSTDELEAKLKSIISTPPPVNGKEETSTDEFWITCHILMTLLIACRESRIDVVHTFFALGGAQIIRPISQFICHTSQRAMEVLIPESLSLPVNRNLLHAAVQVGSPRLFGLFLQHINGMKSQETKKSLFSTFNIASETGQIPPLFEEVRTHSPEIAKLILSHNKAEHAITLATHTVMESFGLYFRSDYENPLIYLETCLAMF